MIAIIGAAVVVVIGFATTIALTAGGNTAWTVAVAVAASWAVGRAAEQVAAIARHYDDA